MKQHNENSMDEQKNKILHFEDSRIYFSKDTERKFFFILTVIMLLMGAGFKLGVWR